MMPRPAASPDLGRRICSAIRRSNRRRRLARAGMLVASLAAVLLATVGIRLFWPSTPSVASNPVADHSAPDVRDPATGRQASARHLPLRNTVTEAREAVASLTTRTADEAIGQTRLLLPVVSGPSLAELELPADNSTAPLRQAGENISAGLGPVTVSARRAVDLFIREFPPVPGQDRKGL